MLDGLSYLPVWAVMMIYIMILDPANDTFIFEPKRAACMLPLGTLHACNRLYPSNILLFHVPNAERL
jgi:hypothetical protein